jgi:iron complex transport system substrate-binding protein
MTQLPQRIVCLTEETTETLYLLGEQHRIVGISGYTVRPPQAREKPRVSAFINAKFDKILALDPDLVLTFSDLQADIAKELIRRGVTVLAFNQRSVAEILNMILLLASVVGTADKGQVLVTQLESELNAIRASAARFAFRPRVFFEEWNSPLISGICWVDELIEIAGGIPIFPDLRNRKNAPERIVDPAHVVPENPDVIIASWCGAKVNKKTIRGRPGWTEISAVRKDHIYEIKSTYILQPGPAALTEGVRQLHAVLAHVAGATVPRELACLEKVDSAMIRQTPELRPGGG